MKRRYVVLATIVSGAILAGAVVGILTLDTPPATVTAASEPEPEPTPTPPPGVEYDAPDWVREQGLYSLNVGGLHLEGKPEEVYGVATTTVGRLVELEPKQASSVKVNEKTRDDPVYAVFVRGKWGVVGGLPTAPEMEYDLVAGRALLDKKGLSLGVQAWEKEKPAVPAFGEQFTDW